MSTVTLPTRPVPVELHNPKNLIIASKPKVGKTTLLATLDNCLILDLESGTDYVEALKMKASSIAEISDIGEAILAAGRPYKYIAIDTATALEEMCVPYAEELYAKTPMGSGWFAQDPTTGEYTGGKGKYGSILNMPNGAGYPYLREAFQKVVDYISTWADHIILVCHIKDTVLDKNGTDINALDLDLTGKIKRITASSSDAIGYLYRRGNKNILSFKTQDEVACGARPPHLRNKEITISEIDKTTGELVTHWDEIYIR